MNERYAIKVFLDRDRKVKWKTISYEDGLDDPTPEEIVEHVNWQADEIEQLRDFVRRIYVHPSTEAWAHDAAEKLLDKPSLAHGCKKEVSSE